MKVTHLTQAVSTSGGGISEVVRALSMAQQDAGDHLAYYPWKMMVRRLARGRRGVPEFLSACHFPGMIVLPDMDERLDQINPQVLHTHGIWSYLSIGVPRWARKHEPAYIVSPHGMLDAWALENSKQRKKWRQHSMSGAICEGGVSACAVCSEADSIRAFGLKNPIATIPNGIEIPQSKTKDTRYKRKDADKKLMLFLGRLHPKKGLENALRAWAKISGQESGVRDRKNGNLSSRAGIRVITR